MATKETKDTGAAAQAGDENAGNASNASNAGSAAAGESTPLANTAEGTSPLSTEHPRTVNPGNEQPKEVAAFQKANAEALELEEKANAEAGLTDDQKKARKARRDADDLRAKANEATEKQDAANRKAATVADAGTLAVVPPTMQAADHFAQKFGNDPANPKLAPGIKPDENLVRLSRITPDVPGKVYANVPKEMAGDYERAGWNRDA